MTSIRQTGLIVASMALLGTAALAQAPLFPIEQAAEKGKAAIDPAKAPAKKAEPAKAEPAKTEPAKTEPAKTEPAKTEPAKTEPGKTEPGKTEPAKTEPGKTEPGKTEPAKTEPAKTEPGKTEPGKTEPGKTEPGKTEPAKTEPGKDAPQGADPKATDPAAADPKADPSKSPDEKGKADEKGKPVEEERKLPTTPQEMLHVLGVDPSHYEMLVDGSAIDAAEDESLLKMIYAVRRFRTLRIHEWLNKRPNLAVLREAPKNHRGDLMLLKGNVTAVEKLEPLPEQVARFELDKYYRCEMTLDADPPVSALIYAAAVPQAWLDPSTEKPTEGWRSSLTGFYLKVGAADRLVFVAPRVGWHPRGLLGELGIDAGMFDSITPGPLSADDREAFYQMLHAMGQLGMHELNRRTILKEGATTFSPSHVRDWPGLAKTLMADGRGPANTPGRSVWNRLPEPLRASLASVDLEQPFPPELQQQVFDALNAIVADPEFFESHRWVGDQVSTAAAGLLAKGFARLPNGALEQVNANLLAVGFRAGRGPARHAGLVPDQRRARLDQPVRPDPQPVSLAHPQPRPAPVVDPEPQLAELHRRPARRRGPGRSAARAAAAGPERLCGTPECL